MRRPQIINAVAPLWNYRSWPVGTCWQSPDHTRRFVPVSKCAHTATVKHIAQLGWKQTDYFRFDDFAGQYIVILRDPVDRWQAGIDVYVGAELGGWDTLTAQGWGILTDVWRVDPHTESQMLYLHGLPLERILALDFHSRGTWPELDGPIPQGVDSRQHWWPRSRLEEFRNSRELITRCQQVYQQDYWLRHWLLGTVVPQCLTK